jgi:hypothetical protein
MVAGPRVFALFTLTVIGRMSGAETSVDLAGVYSFEGQQDSPCTPP